MLHELRAAALIVPLQCATTRVTGRVCALDRGYGNLFVRVDVVKFIPSELFVHLKSGRIRIAKSAIERFAGVVASLLLTVGSLAFSGDC